LQQAKHGARQPKYFSLHSCLFCPSSILKTDAPESQNWNGKLSLYLHHAGSQLRAGIVSSIRRIPARHAMGKPLGSKRPPGVSGANPARIPQRLHSPPKATPSSQELSNHDSGQ
jgi:hypothetical protein